MAIVLVMSQHSVVDAGNHFSEQIDRALAGDDVVITRHGEGSVATRNGLNTKAAMFGMRSGWSGASR